MKTQTPLAVSMLQACIRELKECVQLDPVKSRIKDYEEAIKILSGETVKPVKDCRLKFAHNKMKSEHYKYCSECGKKL